MKGRDIFSETEGEVPPQKETKISNLENALVVPTGENSCEKEDGDKMCWQQSKEDMGQGVLSSLELKAKQDLLFGDMGFEADPIQSTILSSMPVPVPGIKDLIRWESDTETKKSQNPKWKRKKTDQEKGKENSVELRCDDDNGKRKRREEEMEVQKEGEERSKKALKILSESQSAGVVNQPRREQ